MDITSTDLHPQLLGRKCFNQELKYLHLVTATLWDNRTNVKNGLDWDPTPHAMFGDLDCNALSEGF